MKFGTSNHRLHIEVGLWNNLQRHERIYNLCNNNHIGGELYYLLECNVLSSIRNDFFARKHYVQPNIIKFCNFLTNTNSLFKKKTMNFHKQNLLRSFSKSKMSQLWTFRLFVYNYVNRFIYVVPFVTFILFVKKK